MLAAVGGGQEAVITADAGAGEELDAAVLGDLAAPAVEEAVAAPQLESDVLGERMAPIVKSVEDGTFGRKMLLTEESLKIPFPWWILFFVLGAAGVKIYTDKKKKMSAENRTEGQ